jgi:hypothetical protein
MMNEFTKKPEIIFITYNEIIKNPYPLILEQIKTKYYDIYKEFLNLDLIKNLDYNNLLTICTKRDKKNIFEYLALKQFDYEKTLSEIYNKFDDLYLKSNLLSIGNSIFYLLHQKFTEKIYIYSEKYDKRIHFDLQFNFKDMKKVNYVTGPYNKVMEKLDGITTYILNDIMYVTPIISTDKCKYTNILIANYGYNYYLNENNNLRLRVNLDDVYMEKCFKYATFLPAKFDKSYFTNLNNKI